MAGMEVSAEAMGDEGWTEVPQKRRGRQSFQQASSSAPVRAPTAAGSGGGGGGSSRPSGKRQQQQQGRRPNPERSRTPQPAEDLEGLQAQLERAQSGTGEIHQLLNTCSFTPGSRAYTKLIKSCSKPSNCSKALEILEHMKASGLELNTITYTSVITACGRAGQVDKAMELYHEMRERSIHANLQTFTALISACARAKQCLLAASLFDAMQSEYNEQPDHIVYSAMISACEKGHDPARALEVFNQMERNGYEANTMTYNSLLAVLAQGNADHRSRTLSALRDMQRKNISPDNSSFAHVLYVCNYNGLSNEACTLLREAESAGVSLEPVCFSRALEACLRNEDGEAAMDVVRRLLQRESEPSLFVLARALEARELRGSSDCEGHLLDRAIRRLRRAASDEASCVKAFTSTLRLCNELGRCEQAVELCQQLERFQVEPSAAPRAATIGACAAAGQLHKAADCMRTGLELYPLSERNRLIDGYVTACCDANASANAAAQLLEQQREDVTAASALRILQEGVRIQQRGESLPVDVVAVLPLLHDRLTQLDCQPPPEACGAISDALFGQNRPIDAAKVVISGAERCGAAGLPSRQSLNLIRRACISEGKPSYATSLTEWMRSCNMEPDESYEARGAKPPSLTSSSTVSMNGYTHAHEEPKKPQQQQQKGDHHEQSGSAVNKQRQKSQRQQQQKAQQQADEEGGGKKSALLKTSNGGGPDANANGHVVEGDQHPDTNTSESELPSSGGYAAALTAAPQPKHGAAQRQTQTRTQTQPQPVVAANEHQMQNVEHTQPQPQHQQQQAASASYAKAAGREAEPTKLSRLSAAAKEFKPT